MSKPGETETVKARMIRRNHASEFIVDDIMTNGKNEKAERLMLVLSGERDGGGWSRRALVDHLVKLLTQLGID